MPLLYTLTNSQPYLLYVALTSQEAIFVCLNHPRARYQATRDHPYSTEPPKLFNLASSKLFLPCLARYQVPGKVPGNSGPPL